MILAQSKVGRRFVGRLDHGVEFMETMKDICSRNNIGCAEFKAIGTFSSISVQDYDQDKKQHTPVKSYDGAFAVLSLMGTISQMGNDTMVHAHSTFSWEDRGHINVIGGHLIRGVVFSIEFIINTFDDIILFRGFEEKTGLNQWVRVEKKELPPPEVEEPESPKTLLEELLEEQKTKKEEDEEEPIELRVGDFLEHPRLGRCQIQQIDGDERVHIKLENNRLVVLSLLVCRLKLIEVEDNHQVFAVEIKKKGR